ncbi:hypothetical protein HPB52_007605 [Rhipicephalus sanguineus]|uniref:Regulatory protein zeste n=1 Tax=Rhipicephalus sanguineus TaxID=34632 RepID=A0A9D4Q5F7_RHISA|nr:hypothetical protein HPB52_007605 [Rhipicephalus sanguineus]
MSVKGPRVLKFQRDMLIDFLEQHPYLGRSCTEASPRMTAARKKQLWQEITTLLNHTTGGGRVGVVDGRVLDILERAGAVVTAPPEYYPVPDVVVQPVPLQPPQPQFVRLPSTEQRPQPGPSQRQPGPQPQPRRRHPRQLEEAVCRATEVYVRQSQRADARALADRKFHQKVLEQNQRHHEAQMASQEWLENHLGCLTEEVGRLRHVQQQRLDQQRRAHECTQRQLQQLLGALAVDFIAHPGKAPYYPGITGIPIAVQEGTTGQAGNFNS